MKPTCAVLPFLLILLSACAAPQAAPTPNQDTLAPSTRYVSDEVKVAGLEGRHSASHSERLLTYELVIQPDHSVVLDESEMMNISYVVCPDDMSHYPQHQACTPRGHEGPPQRRRHTRYEGRAIFEQDVLTRLEISALKSEGDEQPGFVMPCKQAPEGRFICARPLPIGGDVDINFRLVPRI